MRERSIFWTRMYKKSGTICKFIKIFMNHIFISLLRRDPHFLFLRAIYRFPYLNSYTFEKYQSNAPRRAKKMDARFYSRCSKRNGSSNREFPSSFFSILPVSRMAVRTSKFISTARSYWYPTTPRKYRESERAGEEGRTVAREFSFHSDAVPRGNAIIEGARIAIIEGTRSIDTALLARERSRLAATWPSFLTRLYNHRQRTGCRWSYPITMRTYFLFWIRSCASFEKYHQ